MIKFSQMIISLFAEVISLFRSKRDQYAECGLY